jgi:glutamyl-tRNA reductase
MAGELERAERRHADRTLIAVTGALDRFANELLHIPSVRIRELVAQGRGDEAMAALELLFGVVPDVVELGREQRSTDPVEPSGPVG